MRDPHVRSAACGSFLIGTESPLASQALFETPPLSTTLRGGELRYAAASDGKHFLF